jgi:hypothetical protein
MIIFPGDATFGSVLARSAASFFRALMLRVDDTGGDDTILWGLAIPKAHMIYSEHQPS